MKVLLVPNSYPPTVGGLEVAVQGLARALQRSGHRVLVATSHRRLRATREVDGAGIEVHRIPLAPVIGLRGVIDLVRLVRRERPDVVNSHYVGPMALLCWAARKWVKLPWVVNVHGNDIERHARRPCLVRRCTRGILREADLVLSNSHALLRKAVAVEPSVAAKAGVVGNGLDQEDLEGIEPFRAAAPYLLSVGRFVEKKGQDVLVRAFARVRSRHPALELVLVGAGPTREQCMRLTRHLGLGDAIRFVGEVDRREVFSFLLGSEAFVLPSRMEPFGVVLLEAMAAGTPIVATSVDGVPELIDDGENGLLVQPDDADALASAICALLDDAALRSRLARRGKTAVEAHAWPHVAARYIAAYRSVIPMAPPPPSVAWRGAGSRG